MPDGKKYLTNNESKVVLNPDNGMVEVKVELLFRFKFDELIKDANSKKSGIIPLLKNRIEPQIENIKQIFEGEPDASR